MTDDKARHDASTDAPHAKRTTSQDGVPDQLDKIDKSDSRQEALVDEGLAYADKLRMAGVPVQLELYRGMVHGFIEMAGAVPAAAQAIVRSGDFLRQHLA